MDIEGVIATGHIRTGIVQNRDHNVAGTVILKRQIQRDVRPVARIGAGKVHRSVEHLHHVVNGHPVGTVGEVALGSVTHIDHNILGLRGSINILVGNTGDGTVQGVQLCSGEDLLGIGIIVESIQRKRIDGRSARAHNDAVQTVDTGVFGQVHHYGRRTGLAAGGIQSSHIVGIGAKRQGIQVGSRVHQCLEHIVAINIVTGEQVVALGQSADDNPVVVKFRLCERVPGRTDEQQFTHIGHAAVGAGA